MAAVYEGWEYPPPDCYSCDHRDSEGHLRYKGALLKKGGSRSAKIKTDRNSGDKTPKSSFFGRRNWSDRFFYLDLEKGHWSYYKDSQYENLAGVVRLLPHSSIVVPEEVRLRGRHAPTDPTETLNYFEVHHTTDDSGKVRTAPFVVRAPSPREFEDWLSARVGLGVRATPNTSRRGSTRRSFREGVRVARLVRAAASTSARCFTIRRTPAPSILKSRGNDRRGSGPPAPQTTNMTTTTGSSIDDNAKVDNALQHLPPRKRLAAQMMSHAPSSTTSSDPTSRTAKKRSTSSSGGGENDEDAAALFARYKKMYANRKPSSRVCLLPESDRVREARARAALAAGELPPAAVAAAAEAKAEARAKGAEAAAARRVAVEKAASAKVAAEEAIELARVAEEAEAKAEAAERERAARDGGDAPPNPSEDAAANPKPTDDEVARKLHAEMNASPRGRSATAKAGSVAPSA